nr:lexA repressor-like protein [Terrabacter sp.]
MCPLPIELTDRSVNRWPASQSGVSPSRDAAKLPTILGRMPVANRTQQRGEKSREEILDAASRLMGERGYDGTSIAAVSEAVGIPKSLVFHHFGSKIGLLTAVMTRGAYRFFEAMEAAQADSPETGTHLERLTWFLTPVPSLACLDSHQPAARNYAGSMSNTRSTTPRRGVAVETTASFPNPAQDYFDGHLSLDRHLIPRPLSTFVLRVTGDALASMGIHDGDELLVDRVTCFSVNVRLGRGDQTTSGSSGLG